MNERSTLLRAAGWAAFATIPIMVGSGIALWLFFGGAGAAYGSMNDLLVAVALILLALPVIAIRSMAAPTAGRWFEVVTWLAVGGIVIAAAGQVALVVGLISLEGSFVTGGLGILPVIVWAIGVSIVSLRSRALPERLGRATILLLVAIVVAAIGSSVLPAVGVLIVAIALAAVLAGWLAVLGSTCLQGAAAAATRLEPRSVGGLAQVDRHG